MVALGNDFLDDLDREQRNQRLEDTVDRDYDGTTDYDWTPADPALAALAAIVEAFEAAK